MCFWTKNWTRFYNLNIVAKPENVISWKEAKHREFGISRRWTKDIFVSTLSQEERGADLSAALEGAGGVPLTGYVVISGDYDGDIKVFIKEGKVQTISFFEKIGSIEVELIHQLKISYFSPVWKDFLAWNLKI